MAEEMTRRLCDGVAIVGVGDTPYVRGSGATTLRLAFDAIVAAAEDAGLDPKDIDAVFPPYAAHQSATTEDLVANLGLRQVNHCGVFYMGGASAVVSLKSAVLALEAGIANYAVAFRARNGSSGRRATSRAADVLPNWPLRRDFERPYGWMAPAHWYAMMARRHMIEFGTKSEQLAEIAITQRAYANLNPHAQMHGRPLSYDDYFASRMIADPYRLFDCSLETDGSAAVILTTAERARDLRQPPVLISGIAEGHPPSPDDLVNRRPFLSSGTAQAGPAAFAMSGTTPVDIDAAMIYDPFTFQVILQLELLGFCGDGEGGPFVADGHIGPGGLLPVNTHGGLLSEGHMSGLNHVVEGVRQLRGQGGERQVEGAERILVTGWGDMGDGAVAILRSDR